MADDNRELVTARAGGRCEYCKMHQSLQGATFHIEHVIPKARGGKSDPSNLALACPSCNLHKSDRISTSLTAGGFEVPLFNPRTDDWLEHFDWDDYTLIGKTDIGQATIQALNLNHERRIKVRQAEQLFGLFPPESTGD